MVIHHNYSKLVTYIWKISNNMFTDICISVSENFPRIELLHHIGVIM